MRIHVTSVSRARKLAKRLRAILVGRHDVLVGHVAAQAALARMLGYSDWAELLKVTLQGRHPPSALDEATEGELQARIDYQAAAIAASFPLPLERAYLVAALLGASADPRRRHGSEFRGQTPGGDKVYRIGDRLQIMYGPNPSFAQSIIPSTKTKIFMSMAELDRLEQQSALYGRNTKVHMSVAEMEAASAR